MESSEREEAEWMRCAASTGDAGAFRNLWERYERKIEARCIYNCVYTLNLSRQDAEDAASSTFVQAWSNRGQYRYPKAPKNWLFTIAENECLQIKRKRLQGNEVPLEEAENVPAPSTHDNPWPELVDRLAKKLTAEEMAIFHRKIEEGWEASELAEEQQKPGSTMRSTIAKIRKKAKEVMNAMGYYIK